MTELASVPVGKPGSLGAEMEKYGLTQQITYDIAKRVLMANGMAGIASRPDREELCNLVWDTILETAKFMSREAV